MATKVRRSGKATVADQWSMEGRGARAKLKPEEFALHSGRIRGAMRLAAGIIRGAGIKKEGGWTLDSSLVYVRANMEDQVLVSSALEEGK